MSGSRYGFIATLLISGLALAPLPIQAHPMGNFSINHYAAIQIGPNAIDIRYFIDMAEIPTFQEIQQTGIVTKVGDASIPAYLAREGRTLKDGLLIEVNGRRLHLESVSHDVIFPPGAGGLPTMKMGFVYRATLDSAPGEPVRLHYRDDNFPDRAGWKEIVASAQSAISLISSSVPAKDRSAQLTDYPTDLLNSPPQDVQADVTFLIQAAAASDRKPAKKKSLPAIASQPSPSVHASPPPRQPIQLEPNRQATPRNAFTELVSTKDWGFWFLLSAALIAAGLGAFHALEPGHGKTIVAAYLVGSEGTAIHACLLGLIVTASHTAGVYLLGAVTLYASRYVVPERLYPWLGVGSGLTIAGLGIYLLVRRFRGREHPHSHSHPHAHSHAHDHHHTHHHDHGHHHHHEIPQTVSYKQLLALGVTGGIIPCPAALVVLLSAVALHRIAFGLFLILAFSIGLAAVLITIGLLMVYARRFMSRVKGEGSLITRWLPITSAAFITFLGCAITLRALTTAGILMVKI